MLVQVRGVDELTESVEVRGFVLLWGQKACGGSVLRVFSRGNSASLVVNDSGCSRLLNWGNFTGRVFSFSKDFARGCGDKTGLKFGVATVPVTHSCATVQHSERPWCHVDSGRSIACHRQR
jgi:hypothetical protein